MPVPEDRTNLQPDATRRTDICEPFADETDGDGTILQPPTPAYVPPIGLPLVEGFQLVGEIGRGGMGVVYRALDTALHRDVAVKVLHHRFAPDGSAAQRFLDESRITAQLQHPGIPPIHQVGRLSDGRPFLAMKLIKGQTLEDRLQERLALAEDRGRFLAYFELVCQAVGYAHAHSVIHRDLKPANIMVGAFGEVQVMDWGLAKALGTRGRAAETVTESQPDSPDGTDPDLTAIGSVRDPASGTQTGSVLGTPAYMSPEQARGEVSDLDARTDVFGLGAVLCVVLTGEPPYPGTDANAVRLMAIRGELDGALARLNASGAEPELIALCKKCLACDRAERPKDANELAAAVAAFREALEERARKAELDRVRAEGDRAQAEAQAVEQRKRRRVQLALAGALVLLVGGAGAFAWWRESHAADRKAAEAELKGRAEAEAQNKAEQARQGVGTNLQLATTLRRQYKFREASAALAQAAELAAGGAPERLADIARARADLAFAEQLDDIRYRKWAFVSDPGGTGHFNTKIAPPLYRKAFAERDLDLAVLEPAVAGPRIAESPIKAELVAAVDDWALYEPDLVLAARLAEVARRADPGPWTNRLRDPAIWSDRAAIGKLANDTDVANTSAAALSALAELMIRQRLNPDRLLAAARAKHPSDFDLAFAHGRLQLFTGDPQTGPIEAARALRPDNAGMLICLGVVQGNAGNGPGALAAFRRAAELDPASPQAQLNLGVVHHKRGEWARAIEAYDRTLELDPGYALAHYHRGIVLTKQNRMKDAALAFQRSTELDPTHSLSFSNLGTALAETGDREGARAAFLRSIELDSRNSFAHNGLGGIYMAEKRYTEAIICAKAALAVEPTFANAHAMLAHARLYTGDLFGAHAAMREAVLLDPKRWSGWYAKFPPLAVAPPPRAVVR